jgi:hypothetical protein
MDDHRRVEILDDNGLWVESRMADLRRWQVFRMFEVDLSPVRWMSQADGCPIFVALSSAQPVLGPSGITIQVEAVPIRGQSDWQKDEWRTARMDVPPVEIDDDDESTTDDLEH